MSLQKPLVHIPVMIEEILDQTPSQVKKMLDCTVGGGGHSEALLNRFGHAQLVAFDRDPLALEIASSRLRPFHERIQLQHSRFSKLEEKLAEIAWKYDFIVADLGVSSFQLELPERGFSFSHDGPLDMRMDPNSEEKDASHWINQAGEQELVDIFKRYGEVRFARKIAQGIAQKRKEQKFSSTQQLATFVASLIPRRFHKKNTHPATQVFQALRITVNDEMRELKAMLQIVLPYLNARGRLACIAFHSLEDRLVKQHFRQWENPCRCPPLLPHCVCGRQPLGKRVVKRPIVPGTEEIEYNPRSRSAKLRIFERFEEDSVEGPTVFNEPEFEIRI